MDFGELGNDTEFITKINKTTLAINNIEKSLMQACSIANYDNFTIEEKVKYDIFLSYSVNSLYFMYLKLQGVEPSLHDGIKNEISRIKEAMVRDKDLTDKNTIRPVLDKGAAKRFIRHGLWSSTDLPQNKKTKF